MKLKLFFVFFFITASSLFAQTKTAATVLPSRIKVYTPSESTSNKSTKDNSYTWAVKTDLFAIVSGEFPLIAEYRFAEKFSVEGSLGATYAYLPNKSIFASSNEKSGFDNTKGMLGSAFRATIKFYPSSDYDAIEGWNFGIQVFTKTTNQSYETNSGDSNFVLNDKIDSKTKTGISLIIGKQIFEDSNIAFESFIGIGFAAISREYYNYYSVYNPVTSDYKGVAEKITSNENSPNLQFGLRIGFGN